MKASEFRKLIREEVKKTLNEDRGVILSNEILNFLEERGIIDPSDAQKVHKDLTSFLKSKNIQ
jgi:ribosomal protein L31E